MAQQEILARLLKVAQTLQACGDHVDKKRKLAVQALEDLYKNRRVSRTYLFAVRFYKF